MLRSIARRSGVGLLALAGIAAYELVIRPWHLHWGATEDEAGRELPGDDLIADPKLVTTHAITINAPEEMIWPWLLQLGQGRGGFYSYDWLENLFKLDIHTVERILPDLQDLQVGDTIPFAPDGTGMTVARLDSPHALVLLGSATLPGAEGIVTPIRTEGAPFRATWAFVLNHLSVNTTRLVVRLRMTWTRNALATAGTHLVLEPAHFVMERQMLRRLKHLAERHARAQRESGCREE